MKISVKFLFFLYIFLVINDFEAVACSIPAGPGSVKANAHTLQTIVETYGTDWGEYPENLDILIKEAKSKGYWKDFKNPYNQEGKQFYTVNINNYNLDSNLIKRKKIEKGGILYNPLFNKNKKVSGYKIYAVVLDYPQHPYLFKMINKFLNKILYTYCPGYKDYFYESKITDFAYDN